MANVLVATLGDHPTVVPAMFKALREIEGLAIERIFVLYPSVETDRLIGMGYDLIEAYLQEKCEVYPYPLGFADADSYEHCIHFLQVVDGLLQACATDDVYMSLAGGRKSMSALMAIVCQFHPNVKGLYHLIDRHENHAGRRTFPSITELFDGHDPAHDPRFDPPRESLNLVPVPYACFADGAALRHRLATSPLEAIEPILPDPAADEFFADVFGPRQPAPLLQVYLSETACARYKELVTRDVNRAANFLDCFREMRHPHALQDRVHGTFSAEGHVFHFYKKRRTVERPYYYTEPHGIHLFPGKPVERVIICGLAVEQGSGAYDETAEYLLRTSSTTPYKSLAELHPAEAVLLVPLGEAPMVATQTYVLLEEQEGLHISTVALLYPERNAVIRKCVRLLKDLFRRRSVSVEDRPIGSLADADSIEACKTYSRAVWDTIGFLRDKYPDKKIALSLSGGRKGMSALTLFAAQKAGVPTVYHTVVADPALERRLEQECTLDALSSLTPDQKSQQLFLEAYSCDWFSLFSVPVVPIE